MLFSFKYKVYRLSLVVKYKIMLETPKSLLFSKVYRLIDGGKGGLFKNQSELAKEIVNLQTHYSNVTSLVPFLSAVLNPKSPKPIPVKLQASIIALAKTKLDAVEWVEFEKAFKASFDNFKKPEEYVQRAEDVLKRFIKCVETAHEHHLFTFHPAELNWQSHEDAKRLVKELLEHINITSEQKHSMYHFYFPHIQVAAAFWQKLREYAIHEAGNTEEKADQLLTKANTSSCIKVIIVPEIYCVIPVSYFVGTDENGLPFKMLFSLSYLGDKSSINQFSDKDIENWTRVVFSKFYYDPDKEEVSFEQIRKTIHSHGNK